LTTVQRAIIIASHCHWLYWSTATSPCYFQYLLT